MKTAKPIDISDSLARLLHHLAQSRSALVLAVSGAPLGLVLPLAEFVELARRLETNFEKALTAEPLLTQEEIQVILGSDTTDLGEFPRHFSPIKREAP